MDELDRLLAEAHGMADGRARVALYCTVADRLEAEGRLEEAFSLKLSITHAADAAGLHEHALEAFAWCRAQQRADPRRFTFDTLQAHERLVHALIGKVPRAKFDALIDDFEQACRDQGRDLYRVYWQRQVTTWFRGEEAEADRYAALMRTVPLPTGQCRVCDLNFEIRRAAGRGDHARVLEMAEPILSKTLSCGSVPDNTYPALLYPLLRAGRKEEAERCFVRGYSPRRRNQRYSLWAGDFLRYVSLVEDWESAIPMLERHLGPPAAYTLNSYAFTAYQGAWLCAEKLRLAGDEHLPIRLHEGVAVPRDTGQGVATVALAEWIWGEMTRIGAGYDQMNETDRFAQLLRATAEQAQESYAPRLKR